MSGGDPGEVRKIAVLRSGGLGDLVVTLPAIASLRKGYPEAELVLLGKGRQKEFLEGRGLVDRVEVLPSPEEIPEVSDEEERGKGEGLEAFVDRMRGEAFDLAIHFQGAGAAANPLLDRFGARLVAGHYAPGNPAPDIGLTFHYWQNEAVRYMETARLVGGGVVSPEPVLPVTDEDEAELERASLLCDAETVILHPCASDPRRMWPLHSFAALGDLLAGCGYRVLVTGSREDERAAKEVRQRMKESATTVCGILSLGGLAALMRRAQLVVGPDTGPLHLARSVGAPTVGLYWGPNLINWGPLTRRRHRTVASWKLECPGCGIVPNDPYPFEPKTDCEHNYSFIESVGVMEVFSEAEVLLRETGGERRPDDERDLFC